MGPDDNNSGGDSQPEMAALNRLSENLQSIFLSPESDFFADARVVVARGRGEIPVHRCVLAARSGFFRGVFGSRDLVRVDMGGLGFDPVAAVLGYLYGARLGAPPEGVCVCVDEDCSHATCRPAVDFMVECLCASFMFQVSELVALYQRNLLSVIIDKIAIDDVLVILSAANRCGEACERLLKRCTAIITDSDIDIIALDKALPQHAVKQIIESRPKVDYPKSQTFPDKHAKRIHRALESDDVELVRMLLREGQTNLDEARALHFAVAHCDAKTTTEHLDLGLVDVNCRDHRGYTVLHVAAARREPKIIVSLLTKGARPSDLTSDGRKALQVAKRVTRASDYHHHHYPVESSGDQRKGSPGDRLCIEILDQAERRAPLFGEASVSLAMAGDDLRMKLLYLENRVGLAKLLFPMEAKVIMDISQIDETTEFLDGLSSKRTTVDLNESPFKIKDEHLIRLKSLSRTVELGKRFFPRCSEVLNKITDTNDLSQLAYLGHDTPAERLVKKRKYIELRKVLGKAFDEDKEDIGRSTISSSCSSSTSIGIVGPNDAKLNINN